MNVPRSPHYQRNRERNADGAKDRCVVCAMPVKRRGRTLLINHTTWTLALPDEDNEDISAYLVGEDCLRRHPELRPYLTSNGF